MKTILSILCCTITLTACAGNQQTAQKGPNSDIRRISATSTWGGTGDVGMMAARACDNEGKKLEVISTSMSPSIMSDRMYPNILFRCVPVKE